MSSEDFLLSELNGTERAIFGQVTASDVWSLLDGYTQQHLGSGIGQVRFRAGRIDAVWGVDLIDGRAVVIKSHRPPVDLRATRAAKDAQELLSAAGFPCPMPLSGPDRSDGQVLTSETMLGGETPDGRIPANRRLLADGLARHIAILRGSPELLDRVGSGPSWCRYQNGPWPVPHDTIVDFTSTPPEFAWLDRFARRATDQIVEHSRDLEIVVGHADWYSGNTVIANGELTGTFDWELVADREAVIAGFAASSYATSSTSGGGMSTPEDTSDFLRDYEQARGAALSADEQRAAAGAAAWIVAFNARWQVALLDRDLSDYPELITLVQRRQEDYLGLWW